MDRRRSPPSLSVHLLLFRLVLPPVRLAVGADNRPLRRQGRAEEGGHCDETSRSLGTSVPTNCCRQTNGHKLLPRYANPTVAVVHAALQSDCTPPLLPPRFPLPLLCCRPPLSLGLPPSFPPLRRRSHYHYYHHHHHHHHHYHPVGFARSQQIVA